MARFIDRMVVGLNKGVNNVSEGSKAFVEKAKINTQIQDMERSKNLTFQKLGMLVYDLIQAGRMENEECMALYNEAVCIDERIRDLNRQLKYIEEAKANASAQYVKPLNQPMNSGTRCTCGYINKEGAKFCAGCGQSIAPRDDLNEGGEKNES